MRGKKGKKAKISDFMIEYGRERKTQNPQEMLRTVKAITTGLGGKVIEGEVV